MCMCAHMMVELVFLYHSWKSISVIEQCSTGKYLQLIFIYFFHDSKAAGMKELLRLFVPHVNTTYWCRWPEGRRCDFYQIQNQKYFIDPRGEFGVLQWLLLE